MRNILFVLLFALFGILTIEGANTYYQDSQKFEL